MLSSLLFFLPLCSITIIIIFKIYIKTSTMAIIMALGIITQGVLSNFFQSNFTKSILSDIIIYILISLWISCFFSICMAILKDQFKRLHYNDLINRFGIGTWIAASSICGITINNHFIQFESVNRFIAFLNFCLWLFYIFISIKTFYEIHRSGQEHKCHGLILLTTVSTQSVVLLLNSFNQKIPFPINLLMISIGLILYLICLLFIMRRYSMNSWSVEEDWNNTNCILHGALSISGLACLISKTSSGWFVESLWTITLIIFLIVESIEIYRLSRRFSLYGIKQGLLIYNVTQWSRIFTFAMFYTFTFLLDGHFWYIIQIKRVIISGGIWIILFLLFIEIFIGITSLLEKKSTKHIKSYL
jgi:multisubunit Na+/H+ antiporter MnhG subunit